MTPLTIKTGRTARWCASLLLAVGLCGPGCRGAQSPKPDTPQPQTFQSADDAVVAMVDAVKANDPAKLAAIFGPEAGEVTNSGDPVADQRARDLFVAAYTERAVLADEDGRRSCTSAARTGRFRSRW